MAKATSFKTYCIFIPRETFTEIAALITTAYNIFKSSQFDEALMTLHAGVKDRFALEIYCHQQAIRMCFTTSDHTAGLISDVIYSMMPTAEIRVIEDFTQGIDSEDIIFAGEVKQTRNDAIPIRTYRMMQSDSMAPMMSILSKLSPHDQIVVQYVCEVVRDSAAVQFNLMLQQQAELFGIIFRPKHWFKGGYRKKFDELVPPKAKLKLFRVCARAAVAVPRQSEQLLPLKAQEQAARNDLQAVLGAMRFVNLSYMNRLVFKYDRRGVDALKPFKLRQFGKGFRLSTTELSTLWHPVGLITGPLVQVVAATAGPPRNVPNDTRDKNICFFAESVYRNQTTRFGLKRADRLRHLHIVGKSGSGKSKLIALLAKSDIENGYGVAVIDPHGDLVDEILELIPERRVNDVVLFDPADIQFPASFNPLNGVPSALRNKIATEFVQIFKKLVGGGWSDRLENLVRNTFAALFEVPGATIASLIKMLTDDAYCEKVAQTLPDGPVREFWVTEFPAFSSQFDRGELGSLINKLGELLATDMISNIVRQRENRFDILDVINSQKILLVKLSKGILGDENTAFLGTVFVTLIHQAAMSRSDVPQSQLKDFYLYVDEFHNFATDTFIKALDEARKFNLNITVAHQFLGQLSAELRKSLFGNIGNLVSFRVGGDDADVLETHFAPKFAKADLLNLAVREFYVKMSVDGVAQDAFSGRTLLLNSPAQHYALDCVTQSRKKYAIPAHQVKQIVRSGEEELFSYSEDAGDAALGSG